MKRLVFVALALMAAGCAQQQQQPAAVSSLNTTYELYKQCLATGTPEQCEVPRARFEAARAYADSMSRSDAARAAARPPLVLSTLQFPTAPPPQRQPITCNTFGSTTNCY